MIQITLKYKKSLEENASEYFDKAKKAKKKIEGVKKALAQFEKDKKNISKKKEKSDKAKKIVPKIPKYWYEKFRWFRSSEEFLCVGGRDATQNEILIKKMMDKNDIIFHTEAPGSPFFVIKTEKGTPTKKTFEEVAQATASYSKAWKLGTNSEDAYSFSPDQISKTAESGEYLTKGSFMVRGKRTYYHAKLSIAIGLVEEEIIGGPVSAIKSATDNFVQIIQDNGKPSDAAKTIKKILKYTGHIDDIIRFLPSGKMRVKKKR